MAVSKEVQDARDAAERSVAASDKLEAKLAEVRKALEDLQNSSTTLSQEDKDTLVAIVARLDDESADADAQSA